eukprot:g4202.t1
MLRPVLVVAALLRWLDPASGCASMENVSKRMPEWVGKVPYSHSINKTWGYPTDCSGFVSWVLQADVGHDLKAYEYASQAYSERIETDDLRFGDIITHVWAPWWGKSRCVKKERGGEVEGGGGGVRREEQHSAAYKGDRDGIIDYLPGHVFFFDRWADQNKTEFWAFESTEKEDQTTECKEEGPRFCFNHHVLKKRKHIEKWSSDNCSTKELGFATGGAHRLSSKLLCQPSWL